MAITRDSKIIYATIIAADGFPVASGSIDMIDRIMRGKPAL